MEEELIKRIEKLEKENKQFKTKLTELQTKLNKKNALLDEDLAKLGKEIVKDINEQLESYIDSYIEVQLKKFTDYPELKNLCEGIQYWVNHEYDSDLKEWLKSDFAPKIQQWFVEEVAPEIQDWITGPYAESVQEWIKDYVTERLNLAPIECVRIVTSRIHKDDPELKFNYLAKEFEDNGAKVKGSYGIDLNNHCEKAIFMDVSGIDLDRIMQILRRYLKTSDKTKDPEYYIDFIR